MKGRKSILCLLAVISVCVRTEAIGVHGTGGTLPYVCSPGLTAPRISALTS